MDTKATSNGPVKTTYTTCGGCEKLSLELAKLRKALVVADKALEHYGDTTNWDPCDTNDEYSRHYLPDGFPDDPNRMSEGFNVAQQARTEIANILEGKE